MTGLDPILIGATVVLAFAAIGVTAVLSPERRPAFVYAQLVMMVGIYIGFSLAALDAAEIITRSDWSSLLFQSLIALAFLTGGLGVLATDRPWLLGALILAHGGVDLIHLTMDGGVIPHWYAYACVVFDAIAGTAYVWMLGKPAPTDS